MNILINPENLSIGELATHIISSHHLFARKELEQIDHDLAELSVDYKDQYPQLCRVRELYHRIKKEIRWNMDYEELILFPAFKRLEEDIHSCSIQPWAPAHIRSGMAMLEEDNNWLEPLFIEIRHLTAAYTASPGAPEKYKCCLAALEMLEMDLFRHIHLEKDVLFRRVNALFVSKKLAA